MSTLEVGNIVRTTSKEWSPTGGQSIPAFDHYMAPGVAKTFVKELYKIMCVRYPECSGPKPEGEWGNEDIKEHLKQYRKEHRLILDHLDYVRQLLKDKYSKKLDDSEITTLINLTLKYTEEATHQAMEAVVHNLNSMHCLPYSEKLWVYDTKENTFTAMEIGRLTEEFEPNRFKAVSLNKLTGKAEFKFITAAKKMGNNRKLVKLTSNQGASVKVTDNHKVMTLNGSRITDEYPLDLEKVLSPRGIKTPCVNNDICLTGYGESEVNTDSTYLGEHLVITEDLAEFMGYYVAKGSLSDDNVLHIEANDKDSSDELESLVKKVFGDNSNLKLITDEKCIRFELGSRLSKMLSDKFGSTDDDKKIPIELMFATDNIKSSFIQAYFKCAGRTVRTVRTVDYNTVRIGDYNTVRVANKLIQEQLAFMILSLGGSPRFDTDVHTNESQTHYLALSSEDSLRLGIGDIDNTAVNVPSYDLTMVPSLTKEARYTELEERVYGHKETEYEHLLNIFINPLAQKEELSSNDEYVYDISVADNENFLTSECIYVHNSRAGSQVPFSSLNFGTDTSEEGRMVMKQLLIATDEGLGDGETPIFPISIFKLKSGINFNPGDPNYDIFKLACKVSAKRLFPNFSNLDAPFNAQYYKSGDVKSEVGYMGCAAGKEIITFIHNGEQVTESMEDAWKELSAKYTVKKHGVSEYLETNGLLILDDSSNGFVKCKKFIRNPNKDNWVRIGLMDVESLTVIQLVVTEDHPFPVANKGRTFTKDLEVGDFLAMADGLKPIKILTLDKVDVGDSDLDLEYSYDVETASDRFTLSGIVSNNCRTRVMANVYNPENEVVTGRGNLSFTSINLPRLGIRSNGNVTKFFNLLDKQLELVHRQLLDRLDVQCRKHPRNYPFLMGQGIWIDSDKLGPDDDIRDILNNGTLTVGFIGLAECLKALIGKHHGESDEAQELGLQIIGHMREMTDKWSNEERMNYSVLGTPAEGLSGRFIRLDKKLYGVIPGVTDREYYTNSFHIPVYFPISAFRKIDLEAPYHELTNGGHITYIEMDGDPLKNLDAFERVVRYMHDANIGYGAINHPVDMDPVCRYVGIIDDVCPRCGRREGEPMTPEMWQKVKKYVGAGNIKTCGACGDPYEEEDRTSNPLTISGDK